MQIFDITLPIHPDMLHWGKQPEVTVVESIANGDASNVTRWLVGAHTGTHVDAPAHFVDGAVPVDRISLDVLCGPAVVLDLREVKGQIGADDLRAAGLPADAARVLLRTRNSTGALRAPAEDKPTDWTGLAPDGARLLMDQGVVLVGIDYLTLESPERTDGWDTHHLLLPAEVIILEGADLSDVESGEYELFCLPAKWKDADGAPARTVLVRR
ncbi:cyclase family protein [Kineococcus arenarius]|uniref:cyclase family protein n=1 Tax=unclassified Kineococcus TaxID=2621656 RepID=UPI003D7E9020